MSAQIQVRAREKRILELTIQQLDGIKGKAGAGAGANEGGEGDVRMYKGVGKMCVCGLGRIPWKHRGADVCVVCPLAGSCSSHGRPSRQTMPSATSR